MMDATYLWWPRGAGVSCLANIYDDYRQYGRKGNENHIDAIIQTWK